ncbi:MAG: hypothetical protein AAGK37_14550 [Pseudomonadota bacterium]
MRYVIFFAALFFSSVTYAAERYAGYYFPGITSEEVFDRTIIDVPPPSKEVRVRFVNTMTLSQLDAPEPPRFAIFAKGTNSDTLIMTALDDEIFKTLYRARAQMAQLTASMRQTDFFRELNLDVEGTFFDMLQIMKFDDLVVTDGETWSHRVDFVRN